MVVVAVRNQNAVNPTDPVRQRLHPKIRADINQQLDALLRLNVRAGAKARVAGVVGLAGRAIAAKRRDAARRAGA